MTNREIILTIFNRITELRTDNYFTGFSLNMDDLSITGYTIDETELPVVQICNDKLYIDKNLISPRQNPNDIMVKESLKTIAAFNPKYV